MKKNYIKILFVLVLIFTGNVIVNAEEEVSGIESTVICNYGSNVEFTNKNGRIFGKFLAPNNSNFYCEKRDYNYEIGKCPGYVNVFAVCPQGTCSCNIDFSSRKKDKYRKLKETRPGCSFKLQNGTSINLSKTGGKWIANASDGISTSLDSGMQDKDSCPNKVYVSISGYGAGKTYGISLNSSIINNGVEQDDGKNHKGDYDDLIDIDSGKTGDSQPLDVCSFIDGKTLKQIKKIVGYIQIGVVFLILVLGMLDFTGAIGSGEDNAFKKAGSKFVKRLLAGALVFLIPAIIGIILNLISVANDCGISIFS